MGDVALDGAGTVNEVIKLLYCILGALFALGVEMGLVIGLLLR